MRLFVNGAGMRGGFLHHNIEPFPFLGVTRTAPIYRFHSVRGEYPGISRAREGEGRPVAGELYDVPLDVIADTFLPAEPPEFELGLVRLQTNDFALGVVLRPEVLSAPGLYDISAHGGWRAYQESRLERDQA